CYVIFFFSSRRRHTRSTRDWSSDVCSSDLVAAAKAELIAGLPAGATCIVPAGEPLLEPHLRADLDTVTFGPGGDVTLASFERGRSEERRVGKEGRWRGCV